MYLTRPPQATLHVLGPIDEHLAAVLVCACVRLAEAPESVNPWFSACQAEFLRLLQFTDHETLDHPVAGRCACSWAACAAASVTAHSVNSERPASPHTHAAGPAMGVPSTLMPGMLAPLKSLCETARHLALSIACQPVPAVHSACCAACRSVLHASRHHLCPAGG